MRRLGMCPEALKAFGIDEVEQLLAVVNAAFGVDVSNVRFGGTLGDTELLGDECRAAAGAEQLCDFALPGCQAIACGNFYKDDRLGCGTLGAGWWGCGGRLIVGKVFVRALKHRSILQKKPNAAAVAY